MGYYETQQNSIWACREPRTERPRALDPNAVIGISRRSRCFRLTGMPPLSGRDLRSLACKQAVMVPMQLVSSGFVALLPGARRTLANRAKYEQLQNRINAVDRPR